MQYKSNVTITFGVFFVSLVKWNCPFCYKVHSRKRNADEHWTQNFSDCIDNCSKCELSLTGGLYTGLTFIIRIYFLFCGGEWQSRLDWSSWFFLGRTWGLGTGVRAKFCRKTFICLFLQCIHHSLNCFMSLFVIEWVLRQ